jgi:hypothetical protein
MGIVNDVKDIENHVYDGKPFFNFYVIEKGQIIRYKIIRWVNFKTKIKTFFKKIINIFKLKK